MKIVYLMRHGEEYQDYTRLVEDLTALGREQVTESANRIKEEIRGVEKLVILHSPKKRAEISAKVSKSVFEPDISVLIEKNDHLLPDHNAVKFLVDELKDGGVYLLVGHGPDLRKYAGSILDLEIDKVENGTVLRYVGSSISDLEIEEFENGQFLRLELE